jgi:hypothetical protein
MISKDMSIGERAPLRGYINKPSFSIVIIIYFFINYSFFYILLYNCIPGYILHSLMGAFVEGVLHLHFQCILFPIPFIAIN